MTKSEKYKQIPRKNNLFSQNINLHINLALLNCLLLLHIQLSNKILDKKKYLIFLQIFLFKIAL